MRKLALIVTILVMVLYTGTGLAKVATPWHDLQQQMHWTRGFAMWQVRALGVLELLAVVGLLVSLTTRRVVWAARLAPLGLVALMVGAIATHMSVDDPFSKIVPAIVGLVLSALLAWLRWGPAPLEPRTPSAPPEP